VVIDILITKDIHRQEAKTGDDEELGTYGAEDFVVVKEDGTTCQSARLGTAPLFLEGWDGTTEVSLLYILELKF
jgi:hypothetical protein